jgi:uncharacterized protein (UPF0333 family)
MAKKKKEKRLKVDKKKEIKLEHSILITAILIIISTIFYRFEIAGRTFYLRYAITLFAILIGIDTISLINRDNKELLRNLKWAKRGILILAIVLFLIVIYYVGVLMP